MYCSRRGREVTRPTENCKRCGRCNWERQNQNQDSSKKGSLVPILLIGAVILLGAALVLMR